MSHTPGPWEVFWIASDAGTSARIYAARIDIAHIPMEWNGDGSNANLIAATPDLLAVAKEMAAVEKLCRIFPDKIDPQTLEAFYALGEMARGAIAKAKGRA